MIKKGSKNLWEFRQSAGVKNLDRFFLLVLVAAGIFSVLQFADWWFRQEHIANIWFFILLSLIFWYGIGRLILIWINYLGISKPEPVEPEKGLSSHIHHQPPGTKKPPDPLQTCRSEGISTQSHLSPPHSHLSSCPRRPPATPGTWARAAQRCGVGVWGLGRMRLHPLRAAAVHRTPAQPWSGHRWWHRVCRVHHPPR